MGAIAGEPVDTAPDEEVSVQFPGQEEQLPDVALAVGDVNAAWRLDAVYRVSVLSRVISLSVNCMMTSVASTGQPRCLCSRKASV